MKLPFLDKWRRHPGAARSVGAWSDPEGVAQLLSECELLRTRAETAGLRLRDTPRSLAELDQLQPRWREDPEELPWLGNDAGLYLGTVIVRTVPGTRWARDAEGGPVVVMDSGREIDVVRAGRDWADSGTPELSQVYAEVAED
ncbi:MULTISPECIES: DUF6278 family protein [Streptomyces]|uniref:DUF6278 family protein n=1 Tax=Streptomyces TaxID=1883 RepID=UPI000CD49BB7|nr:MULTISPECIES: DUF6278 family protein [Streptomyces]